MAESETFVGEVWRQPYTAQQIQDAQTNLIPRINQSNKNWERWNISTQQWDDTGESASQTAASAASAQEAKSYAIGGTGSRSGENTDNSKYYSEQAADSASAAADSASAAADSAEAADESVGAASASATSASASATSAAGSAADSEAWAVGQRGGVDVPDTDDAYHNNAKYWAEEAGTSSANAGRQARAASISALQASASATSAAGSAEDGEAWAVGQRGGEDVPTTDPTYHNNAKYWAEEAQTAVTGVSSFNGRNGSVLPQSGDYTAAMVGAIPTTAKGAANGVAELDASGRVPSAQLPAYVDDVLEYEQMAQFPATGESGKIYVDKLTNKTYRWGGTEYVEISESLALGETASTAYAGSKGKANADAIAALDPQGAVAAEGGIPAYVSAQLNTAIADAIGGSY